MKAFESGKGPLIGKELAEKASIRSQGSSQNYQSPGNYKESGVFPPILGTIKEDRGNSPCYSCLFGKDCGQEKEGGYYHPH